MAIALSVAGPRFWAIADGSFVGAHPGCPVVCGALSLVRSATSAPPLLPRPECGGLPVAVLPLALAEYYRVGRSRRRQSSGHADTVAVASEPAAQAGGPIRGAHPVGQGLPGQPEHRACRVGILGPNFPRGQAVTAVTVSGSNWFLPVSIMMRPVPSSRSSTPLGEGGLGRPETASGQDPDDGQVQGSALEGGLERYQPSTGTTQGA